MDHEVRLAVESDDDLVPARAEGRALALRLGFTTTDATLIATAISEIVRNVIVHVGRGRVVMGAMREEARFGLVVVAEDEGPGIPDVRAALEHGYASRGGLGLGLPGARSLMDEFTVSCGPLGGTTVRMVKWRARDPLELLRERGDGA